MTFPLTLSYLSLLTSPSALPGLLISSSTRSLSLSLSLGCCCLHRRHLMVWAVFAPKFAFEGNPTTLLFIAMTYLPSIYPLTVISYRSCYAVHTLFIFVTVLLLYSMCQLIMLSSFHCSNAHFIGLVASFWLVAGVVGIVLSWGFAQKGVRTEII